MVNKLTLSSAVYDTACVLVAPVVLFPYAKLLVGLKLLLLAFAPIGNLLSKFGKLKVLPLPP